MLHLQVILFMDEIKLGRNSCIIPFIASDGIRLIGFLSSVSRRPRRCIVFIHGLNGSAFSHMALSFADSLPKSLALFSINTRGHDIVSGLSKYTDGKRRRIMGGTSLERFEESVFDIKGAIDALSKIGYRDFVLCGHSTGCQKATYYQYKVRDRRVKGIVLVAPADDYNLNRINLGGNYRKIRDTCARMVKSGNGNLPAPGGSGFSAQRLDSVLNLKRVEARLFNYDGNLKEFGSIRTPVLAVFGDREEYSLKKVDEYLALLEKSTSSRRFSSLLISGANHSFDGKEKTLVKKVVKWIEEL